MILVDVYVPSLDKTYDFSLNEQSPVYAVIEEISEMISQNEQCEMIKDPETLLLCSYDQGKILDRNTCMEEHGIRSGSRLMLV
jgi:uncharacterized ubiquitin-like protein YukD